MAETSESAALARIDERTAAMILRLDAICDRLDDVCDTQQDHHDRLARVETRIGILAALSAALSTLAGYLGVRQ